MKRSSATQGAQYNVWIIPSRMSRIPPQRNGIIHNRKGYTMPSFPIIFFLFTSSPLQILRQLLPAPCDILIRHIHRRNPLHQPLHSCSRKRFMLIDPENVLVNLTEPLCRILRKFMGRLKPLFHIVSCQGLLEM